MVDDPKSASQRPPFSPRPSEERKAQLRAQIRALQDDIQQNVNQVDAVLPKLADAISQSTNARIALPSGSRSSSMPPSPSPRPTFSRPEVSGHALFGDTGSIDVEDVHLNSMEPSSSSVDFSAHKKHCEVQPSCIGQRLENQYQAENHWNVTSQYHDGFYFSPRWVTDTGHYWSPRVPHPYVNPRLPDTNGLYLRPPLPDTNGLYWNRCIAGLDCTDSSGMYHPSQAVWAQAQQASYADWYRCHFPYHVSSSGSSSSNGPQQSLTHEASTWPYGHPQWVPPMFVGAGVYGHPQWVPSEKGTEKEPEKEPSEKEPVPDEEDAAIRPAVADEDPVPDQKPRFSKRKSVTMESLESMRSKVQFSKQTASATGLHLPNLAQWSSRDISFGRVDGKQPTEITITGEVNFILEEAAQKRDGAQFEVAHVELVWIQPLLSLMVCVCWYCDLGMDIKVVVDLLSCEHVVWAGLISFFLVFPAIVHGLVVVTHTRSWLLALMGTLQLGPLVDLFKNCQQTRAELNQSMGASPSVKTRIFAEIERNRHSRGMICGKLLESVGQSVMQNYILLKLMRRYAYPLEEGKFQQAREGSTWCEENCSGEPQQPCKSCNSPWPQPQFKFDQCAASLGDCEFNYRENSYDFACWPSASFAMSLLMSLAAMVSVIVVCRAAGDGEVFRFGGKRRLIVFTVLELMLRVGAVTIPWVVVTEVLHRYQGLANTPPAAMELAYSIFLWTLSVLATKWYILLVQRSQCPQYKSLAKTLLVVSSSLRLIVMTKTGSAYGELLWATGFEAFIEVKPIGDNEKLLPIWVWACWACSLIILLGGVFLSLVRICRLRINKDVRFHALCEVGPLLIALATNVIASSNGGWWVPEAHLYSVDDPMIADALLEISTSVERQLALLRDVERRQEDIILLQTLVMNQFFDVLGVILLENWFSFSMLGVNRWSTSYFNLVQPYQLAIAYMGLALGSWWCFHGVSIRAQEMCGEYMDALRNVQRMRRTTAKRKGSSELEERRNRPMIAGGGGRHLDPPLRVIKPVFGFQSGLWASGPVSAVTGNVKKDMSPGELYNMSSPADTVEFFISHCWANNGFHKASKLTHYLFAQQFLAVIWVIWVLPAILLLALGAAGVEWMLWCGTAFFGLGILCTLWVGLPLVLNALARILAQYAKDWEDLLSNSQDPETPHHRGVMNDRYHIQRQKDFVQWLADTTTGAQARACQYAAWRWLGSGISLWLDKACIDQTSDETKAAGIELLDKYLMQAKRLLVLLSSEYLTRMWCVFELALFIKWRGVDSCQFLGLEWPAWYSPAVCMGQAPATLSEAEEELLSNFSCENARCFDPRDHVRLTARITELWGSTDEFDQFVRTRLKDAVLIGKQRYYAKFGTFAKQVLNKAAIGL